MATETRYLVIDDIMFFLKVMIVLFVIICVHCLVGRRQREHNVLSDLFSMFAIIAIEPSKGKFHDELNTPASLPSEFEYFTNQQGGRIFLEACRSKIE